MDDDGFDLSDFLTDEEIEEALRPEPYTPPADGTWCRLQVVKTAVDMHTGVPRLTLEAVHISKKYRMRFPYVIKSVDFLCSEGLMAEQLNGELFDGLVRHYARGDKVWDYVAEVRNFRDMTLHVSPPRPWPV